MRKETQEIINLMLNKFGECRSFETEHFIYWVKNECYYYDNNTVSRDEFTYIKQYAAYNGTLPSIERKRKKLTSEEKESVFASIHGSHPEVNTGTYSNEKMLRYSKTFDSLEYYQYDINVRASAMPGRTSRVLVMPRKTSIFSINNKGCVRIYGNRWLSLKNISRFNCLYSSELGDDVIKILLKSMIGKDWALNLDNNESILISNKNARKADSLEHAIELECGAKPAKIIKKAFGDDINSILNLYSLIEVNNIHYITNFLKKNWSELKVILGRNHRRNMLLFCYFLSKDNRCESQILDDYFKMLSENGKKVNLKIKSYSTLKRNHDELSRQMLLKTSGKGGRLNVAKVYPDITSMPNLQVEKIKTVKRLNQESAVLHHCVHNYKNAINRGECAIYSLFYDGSTYTLELGTETKFKIGVDDFVEEYEFKINQLRGKYNCSPPETMKAVLDKMCEENNLLPVSEGYVYFTNNLKDNRKIVQLGDEILKRIDSYGNVNRVYESEAPAKITRSEEILDETPF